MKTVFLLVISFFISSPAFSQWTQVATPDGAGITDMIMTSDGNLIATCGSFNFPSGKGGVRVSTNQGGSWVNKLDFYTGRTLALGQNGWVWASLWDYPTFSSDGLYVSTNGGVNWPTYNYIVGAGNNIFSIYVADNNQTVYIGTRTGVRKSTNSGINFTAVNNGIPANSWVRDITASSSGVVFAATTNGLFKSTNSATSWTQITGIAASDTVTCVKAIHRNTDANDDLMATTSNGKAYRDTTGLYTAVVIAAVFDANMDLGIASGPAEDFLLYLFYPRLGNGQGGVAQSTLGGTNPVMINDGFPNPAPVTAITSSNVGSDVFAGLYLNQTGGAKVYKRTFTVGVHSVSMEIPDGFTLSQNYPNPFNPATKIKFALPKSSEVKLIIYNELGKEIETLVNKQLSAGIYEADWNAANYSSGVYFYTLTSNGFTDTRKMLLVK